MRNLRRHTEWRVDLKWHLETESNAPERVKCHVQEGPHGGALLVRDPQCQLALHEEGRESGKVLGFLMEKEGKIVAMLDEDGGEAVVAAFDNGEVFRYWPSEDRLEEVGAVEGGVTAVARSPDEELYLLATRRGTVIVMTRDFDALTEVDTARGGKVDGQFVSVGWGKKETQFHGSLGKTAAAAGQRLCRSSPYDDPQRVSLTWRGDGELFAVSVAVRVDDDGPGKEAVYKRHFSVYDREGKLLAKSEDCDGLEHCLAWKPSGAVLAAAARRPNNKYEVVFFEKNGLRHGGFSFDFGDRDMVVRDLFWSKNSDVLATWAAGVEDDDYHVVRLYAVSNYEWSLKREWSEWGKLAHVQWDPVLDLRYMKDQNKTLCSSCHVFTR